MIADRLAEVRFKQGRLLGRMGALGFELRRDAQHITLTEDAVKSSGIEGEALDTEQVRSSVARRLGIALPRRSGQPRLGRRAFLRFRYFRSLKAASANCLPAHPELVEGRERDRLCHS